MPTFRMSKKLRRSIARKVLNTYTVVGRKKETFWEDGPLATIDHHLYRDLMVGLEMRQSVRDWWAFAKLGFTWGNKREREVMHLYTNNLEFAWEYNIFWEAENRQRIKYPHICEPLRSFFEGREELFIRKRK